VTVRPAGLRALETGAVGSAIAASICCLGPLLLAVLGIGGGALVLKFEPYRPIFAIMTVLLLGAAFYLAYRKGPAEECKAGSVCPQPRAKRRAGLWIATGIVVILTALSYLAQRL
jgi:mercuric ion transport protein